MLRFYRFWEHYFSFLFQVVTTVDTMTVPLTEVYFPSVVVCNINQVRKYFRKKTTYTLNKCSFFTKHDFEFLLLRFGPYMSNLRKKNIFLKYQLGFLIIISKKYSKFELCLRFSGSKIVLPRAGDL